VTLRVQAIWSQRSKRIMTARDEPAFRNPERDMIPKGLLRGMIALVIVTVALVSYASYTHRPLEGVPEASTMVRERMLILEGLSAQAVTVKTPDGKLLVDLPHGGFVTVIQSGVATERRRQHITGNPPVRLVEYANHRLVLEDPATGWSAELYAFGSDNKAAFVRLFDEQGATP
jgi:putative photosynthetic complex assembly protein